MIAAIQALRPKQWTKNLLLFAGVVFAQRWTDPTALLNAFIGFAIFCALSGVIYIVNDLLDLEQDRLHPKKKNRAIAAGRISPAAAGIEAAVLFVLAVGAAFWLLPAAFGWLAVLYAVMTMLYSVKLKHLVMLDILVLAFGFLIRALAGIEAINVDPGNPVKVTAFFLLTTLFLALFLAAAKRRAELVTLGSQAGHHRKVLKEYSREFLDMVLGVATAGTVFSYSLWTTMGQFATPAAAEPGAAVGENTYLLVLTIPFVLYGLFRYLWLVFRRDEGGAPETLLVEDIPLLATVALWMIATVAVLGRLSGYW